jgi:hypothetical protein
MHIDCKTALLTGTRSLTLALVWHLGVSFVFIWKSTAHGGCPTGSFSDASGAYCCPDMCGERCGGFGCDLISQDCCRSQMSVLCETGAVPCYKPTGKLPLTQTLP